MAAQKSFCKACQNCLRAFFSLCSCESSRKCHHAAQTKSTWTKTILTGFYKIDCCAAIHGGIWMNNVPNKHRIFMLSRAKISLLYIFSNLEKFESNPCRFPFFFNSHCMYMYISLYPILANTHLEVFPGLVMLFWSPLKNYPSSRKSSGSILRADKQSGLVLKGFWGICAGIGLNIIIKAKAGLQNTDYCTQDCLFCLQKNDSPWWIFFFLLGYRVCWLLCFLEIKESYMI